LGFLGYDAVADPYLVYYVMGTVRTTRWTRDVVFNDTVFLWAQLLSSLAPEGDARSSGVAPSFVSAGQVLDGTGWDDDPAYATARPAAPALRRRLTLESPVESDEGSCPVEADAALPGALTGGGSAAGVRQSSSWDRCSSWYGCGAGPRTGGLQAGRTSVV
jgi:hypothetical protein